MSIDLKHFRPLDPGRINTMDPVEMGYWCATLHCTEAQLEEAVERVGEHVAAVRQHLEDAGIGQ